MWEQKAKGDRSDEKLLVNVHTLTDGAMSFEHFFVGVHVAQITLSSPELCPVLLSHITTQVTNIYLVPPMCQAFFSGPS